MSLEAKLKKLEELKNQKKTLENQITETENEIREILGKYGIPFEKYIDRYPITYPTTQPWYPNQPWYVTWTTDNTGGSGNITYWNR